MKIAIVTCYKDPDYVRARTLRAGLLADPDNDVIIVKNKYRNALRYPEVITRLLATRFRHRPDVYLLTFRGYELLPFFNLITIGKKRIFDEYINLVEWVVYEHKKVRASSLPARLLLVSYRTLLRQSDAVLTDTVSHAAYSADLLQLPPELFHPVPVSTDESLFKPMPHVKKAEGFQVLYYGNMLPLHGLQYVLEASVRLRDKPINFLIIGGKADVRAKIEQAQAVGAHITYKPWVPFDQLPKTMAESAVCLGGPFGNTLQATMVITGKSYQSLAMGVPTLIGSTKELGILRDKENCLIVPQGDAKALAGALEWAYTHQAELERIGQQGKAVYGKYYSNSVVAKDLQAIVQKTI